MKKFLAILLAAMMLLGMTCAFADDPAAGGDDTDQIVNVASITKKYNGALPVGDTLTFTIECVEATGEIPATPYVTLGTVGDTVDGVTTCTYTVVDSDDLTNSITLNITPLTKNGAYTYKITETTTGNDNVTKVEGKDVVYLKVYKLQDNSEGCTVVTAPGAAKGSAKNDSFENTYAVGEVEVKKTIDGNAANYSDKFPATITLKASEPLNMKLQWNGDDTSYTYVTGSAYEYVIEVQLGGEQVNTNTLTGVPAGVTVTLAEDEEYAEKLGYKAAYGTSTGVVKANETLKLDVTNAKNTEIPTGVYVDYIPYVVLLAVAVLGLVAFVVKRRMAANNDD